MQNEQSNGLILKLVVLNFELVNSLDINDLIVSTKPDMSIINTHTRAIKSRFRSIIKFLKVI